VVSNCNRLEITLSITDESGASSGVDFKLEVVVIPVADVDRAKAFYESLGWRLDADFATGRAGRISWPPFLLSAAAVGLSTVNVLVHSRDAWTSVMPLGITLSAVVSVLLLVAAVGGWRVTTARMVDEGDRP